MKTKPYGVRFDIDKMELFKTTVGITTPQRAVNFLFDFWMQNKNLEGEIIKRIEVLELKIGNSLLGVSTRQVLNTISECLYCHKQFEPKSKKAIYCCDKCRNYANRDKKRLSINNRMYIIDSNGSHHLLNKEILLSLLSSFEVFVIVIFSVVKFGNILTPNRLTLGI